MLKSVVASASMGIVAALLIVPLQPAAGQAPAPQGRSEGQRGRGGEGPPPLVFEDRTGFKPIFDGATLKGWDGDPRFWRVEEGAVVGETTESKRLEENTFLIYRGSAPADFELKAEFRINGTNSGIQYRSVHLPPGTPSGNRTIAGKWVLKGYQADIDFANDVTGMLYEERGRGRLALRGSAGYQSESAKGVMGSLESGDALKASIKVNDWNQFHVIARGATLLHILNGHVMSLLVDDDVTNRTLKGLLGFQLHTGAPMKVEFKNVYLKTL
jgi:Domain of Unknown Function (DUF1080)